MRFTWLEYVEKYEKEDVSSIRKILSQTTDNTKTVIEAAFSAHPYMTKREAKFLVESDFVDPKKAPAGIDTEWVKTNKDAIISKIDLMTEHEIRIIVNAQDKSSSAPSASDVGATTTTTASSGKSVIMGDPTGGVGVEVKRGRGRPRKNAFPSPITPAGIVAAVVGDEDEDDEMEESALVKKLTEMGYTVTKKVAECDKTLKKESAFDLVMEEEEEEEEEEAGEKEEKEEKEEVEKGKDYSDEDDDGEGNLDISWTDIVNKYSDGSEDEEEEEEEADGTSEEEYAKDDGLGSPEEIEKEKEKVDAFRGVPSAKTEGEEIADEPIEEAGEDLTDEQRARKTVSHNDPRFVEYLKSLRDRTRSGMRTRMTDIDDMMKDATK